MDFYKQYQLCMQKNLTKQALHYLQQHLVVNREHAYGFYELGKIHGDLGQMPQALCAFKEACRMEPDQAEFHRCVGAIYHNLKQPEQAIKEFDIAYEKGEDPLTRYNRAMSLLMLGRYVEGWQEYEWRLKVSPLNERFLWHPLERLWQGQPFPYQTLVVYTEQGQGDNIQFCRYIPYAKALGGKVVFATWPDLIPIISTLNGVDQIVVHTRSTYESLSFNWAVPLMSLPHIFNTTIEDIPNQTPYLSVPSGYRTKWQALTAPYMHPGIKNIGLVHAGSLENQPQRTCPLSLWKTLFSLPNLQWFSLQKGETAASIQEYTAYQSNLIDLSDHLDDFADTAALLEQMDLLISTDTSVPHLAGALGKPVWLLLPFVTDWRWLLYRSDSPWYPSFRLFRQPLPGQWEPVMAQIKHGLMSMLW